MPLQESTIVLDEEISRLEAEREDLADEAAGLADSNPRLAELAERGHQIDTHLQGLTWARDDAANDPSVPVWDESVDAITLAGLTGGEFGRVEDAVTSDTAERGDSRVGAGATRVYYVAKGTVDAPYVDGDMDFDARVGAVAQLPITFVKWAEHRVDELTTVGGNGGTSFGDLLRAKQSE